MTWPESPELPALHELHGRVLHDPNVVGVVLTGSQARRGMATDRSDVDVYVVLAEPDGTWCTTRSPQIDIPVCTLEQLNAVPGPTEDDWWDRYSFAHARVLLDRLDGQVERLVHAWGTLGDEEAHSIIESHLDGYVKYAYRSLKSFRDGRILESRLDAAESLPWALTVIFALHARVRPYNKYLPWELTEHPLEDPSWDASTLLPLLSRILDNGEPDAQRGLFSRVAATARKKGFGGVLDSWGDELSLLTDGQTFRRCGS